jgi:hypothetical protein
VIYAPAHRTFRGIAAAIATWTLALPLLETLHEADSVHVACPEDGELVDAPVAAAHQHARAPRNGASLFAEHDSSGPLPSDRGHDHCAIASQAHLRGREESRKQSVSYLLQAVAVATLPPEPAQLKSFAIYRFAPKASPPLA